MKMTPVPLNPFMPLPDCANSTDYHYRNPGNVPCDGLHRKIIALRVYFTLIVLNFLFIVLSTSYYLYRNVSAKWTQTSEPTIHLNNQIVSKQWQNYSLKKRGLFGTILGAVGHLVFSTTVLLYQAIVTSFTCEFYLWGPIIGFYIWTYAIIWRTVRIHLLFGLNRLQQRFADHTISEDKEYQRLMQHRDRATRYHLCIFLFSCIIIAVIIIIAEFTSIRANGRSQCQIYWGHYVILSMIVFFFVAVVPFIIWYIRGDDDAHGIRRELWVTVGVGIPCFIVCIVWQALFESPTLSKPAGIRGIFGPSNWLIIVTTTSHVMAVILPLFKTLSLDKQAKRKPSTSKTHRRSTAVETHYSASIPLQKLELTTESLHSALADPDTLRVLQSWAVKDFSVENILFYDRYLHLLQGIGPNDNILDTPLGIDQMPEVIDFYNTFIAENSPLQVNISHKARSTIDTIIEPIAQQQQQQQQNIKPAMAKYAIPLTTSNNDPYMHLTIELISATSRNTKMTTLGALSTTTLIDVSKITLQVFEPARAEVFWNIFSGLFPKIVAANNNGFE